ncbi:hypothetical protein [Glaciihabitans sp. UYNi722]|uniref:hypothetical protein n=1 Tax=Glaciihabitans sp. UYNi722 TaxID=3156344 RepID=UPI0033919D4C
MSINEYAFSHLSRAREEALARELEHRRVLIERIEEERANTGPAPGSTRQAIGGWIRSRRAARQAKGAAESNMRTVAISAHRCA